MRVTEYSLVLAVKHPDADLSALPRELDLTAKRVWKADDPRTTPAGIPLSGRYRESYCCLQVEQTPQASLSRAIGVFLDHLRPRRGAVERVCATGGAIELIVHWYSPGNTGEDFPPSLLGALADMNIALGLDIYGDKPLD